MIEKCEQIHNLNFNYLEFEVIDRKGSNSMPFGMKLGDDHLRSEYAD